MPAGFFEPDLYVKDVFCVPYGRLKKNRVTALFFDIDNTLKPHYAKEPPKKTRALFERLQSEGFDICLVSNAPSERALPVARALGVQMVHSAKKPLLFGLNKARETLGLPRKTRAAIIGDQLFTDILAGKRARLYTVLVRPVSEKESFFIKIRRPAERFLLGARKRPLARAALL